MAASLTSAVAQAGPLQPGAAELAIDLVAFVAWTLAAMLLHELAHGFVATRLGDPSPRMYGRLSLDLRRHVDVVGTIIVPTLLILLRVFAQRGLVFGYAKRMPVRPASSRTAVAVALAGPLTNLILGVAAALGVRLLGDQGLLGHVLAVGAEVNLAFAFVHLLPVPPLDMAAVVARFLPPRAQQVFESLDQYAPLFVLLLFFILPTIVIAIIGPAVSGLYSLVVGG